MTRIQTIFLACALPIALPFSLSAQEKGLLDAQIISGGQMPDARPLAALVLTLAPGWKTYWRSPGEGGLPPEFDWTASQNLDAIEVLWPKPEVFTLNGMTNIGYHERLVLPLAITQGNAAQPTYLVGEITLGICKDICVPIELTLGAKLTAGGPDVPMIQAALADMPMTAAAANLRDCTFSSRPIRDGVAVQMRLDMPPLVPGTPEVLAVEHRNAAVWSSAPTLSRQGDSLSAVFDLVPPQAKPFAVQGRDLRLTILAGAHVAEIWGCNPQS